LAWISLSNCKGFRRPVEKNLAMAPSAISRLSSSPPQFGRVGDSGVAIRHAKDLPGTQQSVQQALDSLARTALAEKQSIADTSQRIGTARDNIAQIEKTISDLEPSTRQKDRDEWNQALVASRSQLPAAMEEHERATMVASNSVVAEQMPRLAGMLDISLDKLQKMFQSHIDRLA
jgi:hypothetical protein